jgi:hypothetical protein
MTRPQSSWEPSKYKSPTAPPPDEQIKQDQFEASTVAAERWGGALDFAGRAPKRLKPRRTVDYTAAVARWQTVSSGVVVLEGYGWSGTDELIRSVSYGN